MFNTLIIEPIFNMLLGLYSIVPGGDFGISIILFTILVRFALWPLVKKQMEQTKAMRKVQPEMVKIKKKAKGNKQLEGVMMLELYKKYGINPFRSIGILLVQLPILIALYRVILIITTEREKVAEYAYGFIKDLGPVQKIIDNPGAFNETLFGFIDLTETALAPNIYLFIMAIGAAALQYYMAKQTTPTTDSDKRLRDIMAATADGQEPDQSEVNAIVMRKMIKVMPLILFFIIISVPGALALYFVTSNLVAVIQQHHILKDREEELSDMASSIKPSAAERAKKATVAKTVPAKTATIKTKQPNNTKPKSKPKTSRGSTATKVTRITAKDTKNKRR